MASTAGTDFLSDIITIIKSGWRIESGGNLPTFDLQWEIKEVGHGNSNYDEVIVSFDSEDADIFSLISGEDNGTNYYDWLHNMSLIIDIRTGKSKFRVLQITNEIIRILKANVVAVVENRTYLRILPEGITNLNDRFRNLFRMTIGVNALRHNP